MVFRTKEELAEVDRLHKKKLLEIISAKPENKGDDGGNRKLKDFKRGEEDVV